MAVVPGETGDADRFPFLPETLRRVAKKVWNGKRDAFVAWERRRRRGRRRHKMPRMQLRYVFDLSAAAMRCRSSNREMADLFDFTHRTRTTQVRCGDHSSDVLIVGYSEVGQRSVAAERTVVIEYDMPRESRWGRVRIERRRHLSSPRVGVDAVFE